MGGSQRGVCGVVPEAYSLCVMFRTVAGYVPSGYVPSFVPSPTNVKIILPPEPPRVS